MLNLGGVAMVLTILIALMIGWAIKKGQKKSKTKDKKQTFKKWRGKPLYRKGGRAYWKGIPVDDDEFESVRQNPAELRQYNFWVKKLNKRKKF